MMKGYKHEFWFTRDCERAEPWIQYHFDSKKIDGLFFLVKLIFDTVLFNIFFNLKFIYLFIGN